MGCRVWVVGFRASRNMALGFVSLPPPSSPPQTKPVVSAGHRVCLGLRGLGFGIHLILEGNPQNQSGRIQNTLKRQTDRRTDRQTDRPTETETETRTQTHKLSRARVDDINFSFEHVTLLARASKMDTDQHSINLGSATIALLATVHASASEMIVLTIGRKWGPY